MSVSIGPLASVSDKAFIQPNFSNQINKVQMFSHYLVNHKAQQAFPYILWSYLFSHLTEEITVTLNFITSSYISSLIDNSACRLQLKEMNIITSFSSSFLAHLVSTLVCPSTRNPAGCPLPGMISFHRVLPSSMDASSKPTQCSWLHASAAHFKSSESVKLSIGLSAGKNGEQRVPHVNCQVPSFQLKEEASLAWEMGATQASQGDCLRDQAQQDT